MPTEPKIRKSTHDLALLIAGQVYAANLDPSVETYYLQNKDQVTSAIAQGFVLPVSAFMRQPASSLLDYVGIVRVPATTEPFVVRDRFVANINDDAPVKISIIHDGFKDRFFKKSDGEAEWPIGDTELRYYRLKVRSVDTPIIGELGGPKKIRTTLAEVYALMVRQLKGPKNPKGPLLTNGCASIFYVETTVILPSEEHLAYINEAGEKVVLCTVIVYWGDGGGWDIDSHSLLRGRGWYDGRHVFSRNSVLKSLKNPASVKS